MAHSLTRRSLLALLKANVQQSAAMSHAPEPSPFFLIDQREVVGFGANGTPQYMDRIEIPFPGIRFKETTSDIKALREKEVGDWSKLTIEEKKTLYRASFCQTFSELHAPSGEWKSVTGGLLVGCAVTIWITILLKTFVYDPIPDTNTNQEKMHAQLQRMIDLRVGHVEGISSEWDYEKNDWKK